MAKSTEVATTTPALPALATTPATSADRTVTQKDVNLPKLYRGETQSNAFKDGLVSKGCIFIATGGDDPEPVVVAEKEGDPVRMYVLDWFKSYSFDGPDGFKSFAFDDPNVPEDAWLTHNYIVALPDHTDVPVKVIMSKSSTPTAKNINFLRVREPGQILAFDLTVEERKSDNNGTKYQWYIWKARRAEVDPAHIETVTQVAALVTANPPQNDIEQSAGNTPDI